MEPFLPLCHRRDTSRTTAAKPLHSKGMTKKMSSENNVLKSNDGTVRIHPPKKTSSSGNERLSKWHHQGFHHPLQNNGLKNKIENQQISSTVPNSQVRKLSIILHGLGFWSFVIICLTFVILFVYLPSCEKFHFLTVVYFSLAYVFSSIIL